MSLYSIHPRFVEGIREKRLKGMIFPNRRYNDGPGDTMYLFSSLGTSASSLLATPLCSMRKPILLESAQYKSKEPPMLVFVGSEDIKARNPVVGDYLEQFAQEVGFSDYADMEAFYSGKLPFWGQLYQFRWTKKLQVWDGLKEVEGV